MSEEILQKLKEIQREALKALEAAGDEAALQSWKTAHLGRSSAVMQVFTQLGQVPKELRPQLGQAANEVKVALEGAFAARMEAARQAALERALVNETLDVTLPGRRPAHGRLHPATTMLREICQAFGEMGFQMYRSPEVETEEYNFELVNIPAYHPARDM